MDLNKVYFQKHATSYQDLEWNPQTTESRQMDKKIHELENILYGSLRSLEGSVVAYQT